MSQYLSQTEINCSLYIYIYTSQAIEVGIQTEEKGGKHNIFHRVLVKGEVSLGVDIRDKNLLEKCNVVWTS